MSSKLNVQSHKCHARGRHARGNKRMNEKCVIDMAFNVLTTLDFSKLESDKSRISSMARIGLDFIVKLGIFSMV